MKTLGEHRARHRRAFRQLGHRPVARRVLVHRHQGPRQQAITERREQPPGVAVGRDVGAQGKHEQGVAELVEHHAVAECAGAGLARQQIAERGQRRPGSLGADDEGARQGSHHRIAQAGDELEFGAEKAREVAGLARVDLTAEAVCVAVGEHDQIAGTEPDRFGERRRAHPAGPLAQQMEHTALAKRRRRCVPACAELGRRGNVGSELVGAQHRLEQCLAG
jgi:hypothetical protein